jgi:hypothetical protein
VIHDHEGIVDASFPRSQDHEDGITSPFAQKANGTIYESLAVYFERGLGFSESGTTPGSKHHTRAWR